MRRRYRLIGKKGEGTFSEVLKAQGIKNGKYVAIKCMKNHFDSLDQVNNLREIQALRRLSPHPGIIKLCEVLYEAGIYHIADTHDPTLLILWNNRDDQAITYRYGDAYLYFGMPPTANHDEGVAPHFKAIVPNIKSWKQGAMEEHVWRTQWQLDIDYHHIATVTEHYHEQTP